jgi:hypothetical protein
VKPVACRSLRDLPEQRLRVPLDEPLERLTASGPFKENARIEPKTVTGDLRTALCQRLAQLPPPPLLPRTTGVVIASRTWRSKRSCSSRRPP